MSLFTPHNVVLIQIPFLRKDSFSFLGNRAIKTPGFDRLAQEGIYYTHAYNPHVVSKEQMETDLSFWYNLAPFKRAQVFLWSSLVAKGYALYESHFDSQPIQSKDLLKPAVYPRIVQEDQVTLKVKEQKSKEMARWVSFVEKNKSKRFIAHFSSDELRAPFHAEQSYYSQVKEENIDTRLMVQQTNHANQTIFGSSIWEENHWTEMRKTYLAQVAKVDKGIHDILFELEKHQLLDTTLVVVYAQASPSLGDYGYEIDPGHPLKEDYYHVPLFIRFPSHMKPNPSKSNQLVSLSDIWPTVFEAIGLGDHSRNRLSRGYSLSELPHQVPSLHHDVIKGRWMIRKFFTDIRFATYAKTPEYNLISWPRHPELHTSDDPYGLQDLAKLKKNSEIIRQLRNL